MSEATPVLNVFFNTLPRIQCIKLILVVDPRPLFQGKTYCFRLKKSTGTIFQMTDNILGTVGVTGRFGDTV